MSASSSVAWFCAVALALVARASFAQDAPTAPAPSAVPTPPPDAPPPFAEPAPAPGAPAPPDAPAPTEPPAAPTPSAAPQPPTPPAAPANTGSAAFAPLPPSPKPAAPRAVNPKAEPSPAPEVAPAATPMLGASSSGPDASSSQSEDSPNSNGIFGPFRIGALIGGGLPDLISLGGMIKVTRFFGAGINVGLIPTVKISYYGDATLSFQEYDAYGHIFPFGGAFFFGAGVGYATVKGTLANRFDLSAYHKQDAQIPASVDVSSQASVRTLVLTPQLGLLHTFGSGFTLGADVGAQIPIAPSQVDFTTQIPSDLGAYKAQIQTQYIDPNDAKVRSSLDKIGRTPVPTFGIKIGWLL